ncbi:Uncharacterised protein [Mycobacteroides abscessus subsp. abscessus]|nr:Uncharacterised protein [Mycobacteroides abscessus subsp. abscessus]
MEAIATARPLILVVREARMAAASAIIGAAR